MSIKPVATFGPASDARAWSSATHPTLPIIATACSDRTVRIYSLSSFKLLSSISGGHKRSIRNVAWKPGSGPTERTANGVKGIGESVLATASFDACAGIWRRWEGTSGYIRRAPVERDFTQATQDDDEEEPDGADEWRFAVILEGHDSEIKSVAFSPTSPLVATCSRDKSVWIWEEMEDDNFETVAVLQEHEGDVKCVAWHPQEELLASASYDDTIRLWREDIDDWTCCACLSGHDGTVWWVEFEQSGTITSQRLGGETEQQTAALEARAQAGPRLLSCSDDMTIRVWRRLPKEKKETPAGGRLPSILRSNDIEEDWVEDSCLPKVHDRSIYAVSWSKTTGRIVSCSSDGKIVVYEERWTRGDDNASTEWCIIAELDDAHGVFEINHICWTAGADLQGQKEEMIITTGDDGAVRAWTLTV